MITEVDIVLRSTQKENSSLHDLRHFMKNKKFTVFHLANKTNVECSKKLSERTLFKSRMS